jgi:hypothetical protein
LIIEPELSIPITIEGFSTSRLITLTIGDKIRNEIRVKVTKRRIARKITSDRGKPDEEFLKYKIAATPAPNSAHNIINQTGDSEII